MWPQANNPPGMDPDIQVKQIVQTNCMSFDIKVINLGGSSNCISSSVIIFQLISNCVTLSHLINYN